jgi:sortase A
VKLTIAREPLKRVLLWSQRSLLAIAISIFVWCSYVLIDTWSFQRTEQRQFEGLRADRIATTGTIPPPVSGGLIGRIDIPRLDISVVVIEGTGAKTLRRAVGHIRGTALPGHRGNIGISGHRDTFFRPLRNIRNGDVINLTTLDGEYHYRVVSTNIVMPSDVAVLRSDGSEALTLVTCHPFYFVGAAPNRFIVRAERIE